MAKNSGSWLGDLLWALVAGTVGAFGGTMGSAGGKHLLKKWK